VELALPGGLLEVGMEVPTGEVSMQGLLPALRTTADAFVAYASERTAAEGKPVSCAKGCGACCRQLVPLAEAEARRLASVVEELPEPRRSAVRKRFADAVASVEASGLLPALEGRADQLVERNVETGLAYFALGIPCPFLEDESCSIYAERPIACREYLVSSPPAACSEPSRETVVSVPLPTRVWAAMAREEKEVPGSRPAPCIPLVVALRWAAAHLDAETLRPGPELLRSVYARFSRDRSSGQEAAG
jgi:Fe-S-cluster containining protein